MENVNTLIEITSNIYQSRIGSENITQVMTTEANNINIFVLSAISDICSFDSFDLFDLLNWNIKHLTHSSIKNP